MKRKALLSLACAGALALLAVSPLRATEGLADLEMQLRLLGVDRGKGNGPDTPGAARIEVVLTAAKETQFIELAIEKADGSPWVVGSRPFELDRVQWRRADGTEPPRPANDRPMARAGETLRAVVIVPLQGAAVHEVILRAKGFVREGRVSTEAMVRAPLGASLNLPIEKDGLAVFEPKKEKP